MTGRGLLADVHGVLYIHPDPLAGSVAAVRRLEVAGFPHLFLTNSSLHPKSWILQSLHRVGFTIPPGRLMTAVEAAGDYLAARGHHRIGWLCVEALTEDLPGFEPVFPGSGPAGQGTGSGEDRVDAVLVGDLGDRFTHATLNRAFRWILGGSELVAIGRNRAYQTPDGLTLDAGPYVALLENATGAVARVTGKPDSEFFRAALRRLGADSGELPPGEVAMVGDDLEADVLPAMRLGLRGIQVRTGKFREAHYASAPEKAHDLVEGFSEAVDLLLGS